MAKQYKRNPVARAAILRKGGVHEKCRSGKRLRQKRELHDLINEYYSLQDKDNETRPALDNPAKTTTWSGRFFWGVVLDYLSVDQLFYSLHASFVIFVA